MIVDSTGRHAFVFGGRASAAGGDYTNFNDVWMLNLETLSWTEIATTGAAPTARSHAALAHDAARDRLIVFGGNVSTSGLAIEGTRDTWVLDLSTGVWTQLTLASSPPQRYAHAFTSSDSELFVFGGSPDFAGPFRNDVWAFDFATDTWRMVSGGGPGAPNSRFGAGLFAAGNRLVMVAGHDSTDLGNVNDLWTLDLSTGQWTEVVHGDALAGRANGPCDFPADFTTPDLSAPERRHYFGATQSAERGFVVMGKTDCGNVNDVWSIDLAAPVWSLQGNASTAGEACNRSGATACASLCF